MKRRMPKIEKDILEFEGEIVDSRPNAMFMVRVGLQSGGTMDVLTTLCGKMRQNFIRVTTGDRVAIEVSQYDTSRGRIMTRA